MNITNEQIIQSARRQRQIVDSQINIEPWQPRHRRNRGIVAAIAVAASITTLCHWHKISRCNTTPSYKQRLFATPSI